MLVIVHKHEVVCKLFILIWICEIDIMLGIRKHEIHEIGLGTKLYYLWVKGYSTWGERKTIFLCWLLLHRQLSTQPTHGARSAQSRLASAGPESQPSSSEAGTQLTAFSQISAHAYSAWRHPHPLVSIPIWVFYFDISEWQILPACAWTLALMFAPN